MPIMSTSTYLDYFSTNIPVGDAMDAGYLFGLTLSNDGTDPTNDIGIATGKARDSTDAADMSLTGALIKRLDAAWAVGTNQGGLDTGAIANTTYFVWLIKRSDTGVVDVLFSTSATAPTMPASYDYKRRIGSIVRLAAAIILFVQDGDVFKWKVPFADVNAQANPGTAAMTKTLTLPVGIRIEALVGVAAYNTNAAGAMGSVWASDLSVTDTAPGINAAFSISAYSTAAAGFQIGGVERVFTNTSAQVRVRVQISAATSFLYVVTHGWIDTRGRI